MKLENGMYVRTKDGHVDKIIKINNNSLNGRIIQVKNGELDCCMGYTVFTDLFSPSHYTKASFNIIDLFEEKDLVEIEFYSLRAEKRITRLFEVDFKDNKHITFANAHCQLNIINGNWSDADTLLEPIFKSIVTKEQFENVEYRIGDE